MASNHLGQHLYRSFSTEKYISESQIAIECGLEDLQNEINDKWWGFSAKKP